MADIAPHDLVLIAAQLCQTPVSGIMLLDEDYSNSLLTSDEETNDVSREHSICARAIEGSLSLVIEDTHQHKRFAKLNIVTRSPYVRFYAGFPLYDSQGHHLGLLSVIDDKPHHFTPQQQQAVESLARQIGSLVEHHQLTEESEELDEGETGSPGVASPGGQTGGIIDELTQVFNMQYLQQDLVEEIQRARRYQLPLALMLLDIDMFQGINDDFGYKEGNRVLQLLARQIVSNTRDTDTVARYGGDEFVIILPCTALETALMLAERLRWSISQQAFHAHYVTVSTGVTQLTDESPNAPALLEAAEQALYQAKRSGRNCVEYSH